MVFSVSLIAVVLLANLFVYILVSTNRSELKTLNTKISSLETSLNKGKLASTNKLVHQFESGLLSFKNISGSQENYPQFFNELKARVIDTTRLRVLSLDTTGKLVVDGDARNFNDIAILIESLNKSQKLSDVTLVNSGTTEQFKTFNLTGQYVYGGGNGQ